MKFGQNTITAAVFGTIISLSFPAFAQDMEQALKTLDDALPGKLIHNPYEIQWDTKGPNKKIKIVDAPELPMGKALRAKIKRKTDKPWDIVVYTDIEGAVKSGEKIEAHFYARTKTPRSGQDTATITLFIGRNEEPFDNIISEDIKPSKDWKLHTVRGIAKRDYDKGTIKAEYQLGQGTQTVEFGSIYISSLGKIQ